MHRLYLITFFLFYCLSVSAQFDRPYFERILAATEQCREILPDSSISFRLAYTSTLLEVANVKNEFRGSVTYYTYRYSKKRGQQLDKPYCKTFQLSSATAFTLDSLFHASSIADIADSRRIAGWQNGCDGRDYYIERFENDTSLLKSYWQLSSQKGITEAMVLQEFVDSVSELADIIKRSVIDTIDVPQHGCYTYGGIIRCYGPSFVGFNAAYRTVFGPTVKVYPTLTRISKHFNNSQLSLTSNIPRLVNSSTYLGARWANQGVIGRGEKSTILDRIDASFNYYLWADAENTFREKYYSVAYGIRKQKLGLLQFGLEKSNLLAGPGLKGILSTSLYDGHSIVASVTRYPNEFYYDVLYESRFIQIRNFVLHLHCGITNRANRQDIRFGLYSSL